jgi:uncharacterized protein YbjT (DUF2867 family)
MDNHGQHIIAVTGATGQQGGAVARALLSAGWKVRVLTRDTGKPAARALSEAGAELVTADNDDRASVEAAFKGAYGVFSVQNFWLPNVGASGEVRQGKVIAETALKAGIRHFVYSSVGAAHRGMGQAHFASKHAIEEHIRSLRLPHTFLRPVFFMENFNWQRPQITNGSYAGFGLRPEKGIQMVAVQDIGAFAAMAFDNPREYLDRTIELAGDELTELQIVAAFTKVIGRPVTLAAPRMPGGAETSPEQAAMFQFFNGQGYDADIPALRRTYPPLSTLELWLRATGWENAAPIPIPKNAGWPR